MSSKGWSWSQIYKYIWPPTVFANVMVLLREWRTCDAKDQMLLSLLFLPALVAIGGFIFTVAYFVLFKLPSFVLSLLGWLLLISIFCSGGLFGYEKIRGKSVADTVHRADSPYFDATVTAEHRGSEGHQDDKKDKNSAGKDWFNNIKNMKWPR